MQGRGVTVIFVAIATVLLINNYCTATNSTWGIRGRYDYLLHREQVVKSSSWFQVITRKVIYPPKGFISRYNITYISAIDHKRKDGGYPALTSGGIGKRNATVLLTSERGHGLNYTVEIYGH